MERKRIYKSESAGQVTVDTYKQLCMLLLNLGYTVRIGKDKSGKLTKTFVEYWEEQDVKE